VINEDDIDPKSFVPQHIEQKVEIRVKKHLSDNPAETKSTFDVIEKRIDFFDISEYFDLISSKDNWQYFEPIFGQKPMLQSRFSQLQNIRNAVAHSRELNDVMVKDGEAAILWFSSALRKYMTECVC
jgi:abortive infection bacteriophage resistance protein